MIDSRAFSTLNVVQDAGILRVALDRPQTLNALTPDMMRELAALMHAVHLDASVRVVVITGSGRAFSAGGDIDEDAIPVSKMTPWEYRLNVETYARPMLAIAELDRPVIAAINGAAVGGGWDLALACDIRIASDKARFRDAYVQLGVVPELGGTWYLPRLAGLGRAKLISFTGEFVSAEEALSYGLVEEVVEPDALEGRVLEIARKIAAGPMRAIGMTKLAMNVAMTTDMRAAVDHAKTMSPALLASPDYHEALAAFMEKRAPRFEGA